MIYIDFDGVILDTDPLLFEEWRKQPNHLTLPESLKIEYMKKQDWNYIINNSNILNDSIYYLKQMDPKTSAILTTIHSYENEGIAKLNYLRNKNIKQQIILVPYTKKKTDCVNANNNILIDDSLFNLDHWSNNNGKSIFFDYDDDNIDSRQRENVKNYKRIRSLSNYKNLK